MSKLTKYNESGREFFSRAGSEGAEPGEAPEKYSYRPDEDPFDVARGLLVALLFSLIFWGIVLYLSWP